MTKQQINYWVIKSEPKTYSWQQFVLDGKTTWDGVRNFKARNNLKAMKIGDLAFFYHSNQGLEIKGLARVIKEFYPDPTSDDTRWVAVDFKPVATFKKTVTLQQIKSIPLLADMELVRMSRLSVSAVTIKEYKIITQLTKE